MPALYDAFVSYSHAKDKAVAAGLQSAMQKLGKPWHKRRALRIFRDDTSLAATPELWPTIEQALGQSRYFIALASPQFARSKWCGMEVAHWLEHRNLDTLLIAVTEGELSWDDAAGDFRWEDATPLPTSLKGKFRSEPKWIDLRAHRNAPDVRAAKFIDAGAALAAAVHGIPKEDLLSQELRQQKRALTLAWSATIVLLALTGVAGWQWAEAESARRAAIASEQVATEQRGIAEQQRADAQAQRDRAERNLAVARQAAEDLVVKIARGLRDVQGMQVESIRQILETAQAVMDELVRSAPDDPKLQRTRANMLSEFALVYVVAGDFDRARRAAEDGLVIMRQLAAAEPGSAERQRDVSVVLDRLGDARMAAGDKEGALAAYEEGLAIARRLSTAEPKNAERQRDVYVSLEKVGDARLAMGDQEGGLAILDEGLATMRKLAAADPGNTAWRRDLGVILNKVGDVRLAVGDRARALTLFEESLQVARGLVAYTPGNVRWQRDLSISLQRVGDVRLANSDRVGALALYEEALNVVRRLVTADSSNTQFQTSLVVMLYKVSTASELSRAREALSEAVALVEALERDGKLTAAQREWPRLLRNALASLSSESGDGQ